MVQGGEDLGLALEPGDPFGVEGEGVGQDLDRDLTIQLGIEGAIHLPHATLADEGGDLIHAEASAGWQGQSAGLYERPGRAREPLSKRPIERVADASRFSRRNATFSAPRRSATTRKLSAACRGDENDRGQLF
jgi:hypothetical protein